MPALVSVRTNIPAADVLIDGTPVGRTPLANYVAVPPGDHMLELRRRGYRDVRRPLTLAEGARADLTVELFADPGAPRSDTGTLAVLVSENDAVLLVDGQARTIHRNGRRGPSRSAATTIEGLPMGPHVLRVERAGFLPAEQSVFVPPGQTTSVQVTLRPTHETYLSYIGRTNAARGWAVATISAGFALAVTGGAVAITRNLSLPDAYRYRDEERREQEVPMSGGACDRSLGLSEAMVAECDARLQAAYDAVTIRQRLRLLGTIGAGVGLAAVGLGVYLLMTGDDPTKYDAMAGPGSLSQAQRRFWTQAWVGPSSGGLLFGRRF